MIVDAIMRWLARLFPLPPSEERKARTEPLPPGSWCLVGNIGGLRDDPPPDAAAAGTKHFSFGTKVYCLPPQWGDGYERLVAVGRRRGSHRLVEIVMLSNHVTNWRAQAVHEPAVLRKLGVARDGLARQWKDEAEVRAMVESLLASEARRDDAAPVSEGVRRS